ncbi:MAG: lytic transglycosylase domain-containing protein [Alphaproteobacteria bacterium]
MGQLAEKKTDVKWMARRLIGIKTNAQSWPTKRVGRIVLAWLMLAGTAAATADTPRPNFVPQPEVGITPHPPARDLPLTVLTARDRGLYKQIFAYQDDAKWGQADRLIKRLNDPLLVGHILRDRYLHPNAYRSSYTELADWLATYYELPDAYRVYRLAKKKQPKRASAPKRPRAVSVRSRIPDVDAPDIYQSNAVRNKHKAAQVRAIQRKVTALVDGGYVTRALDYLKQPDVDRHLDAVETDQQRAKIAAGYYHWGQIDQALDLAEQAAGRSGQNVPLAHWYAGLSWWQKGNIERAAYHFEQVANSRSAGPWTRAAGAYWAARASLILLRSDNVVTMLNIAAAYPRTLYGLLALRALGQDIVFRWDLPKLSDKGVSRLLGLPGVRRAIALTELGMDDKAEDEMALVYGRTSWAWDRDLVALAVALDLPALQYRIGRGAENYVMLALESDERANVLPDDLQIRFYDAALYPLPRFTPAEGFAVNPALVYAFVRQESRFRTEAKSGDGARGLMQIMPQTASFIMKDDSLSGTRSHLLNDPSFNLEVGQTYLGQLLGPRYYDGDLFRMAAAYNGGPGNLRKWSRRVNFGEDPLLFIESLPSRQTRNFIERVMTNYWIYRLRLGQDTPSLDELVAGQWPQYEGYGRGTTHGKNPLRTANRN